VSERDTRIRRAKAKRAWGRGLPTRWNFPADGVSRALCPCLSYHAPSQDVPGITLSSVKLKNLNNRCLGTMPGRSNSGPVPRLGSQRRGCGLPLIH
jgi:hypothetical protein